MKSQSREQDNPDKERIRAEIERQVEDFLRKGGQINILTDESRDSRVRIGNVWHGQDEFHGMGD